MNKRTKLGWTAGLVVLLGLTLFSSIAGAQTAIDKLQEAQREIFGKVAPSVVFLSHDDSAGSGFFVSSNGDILTNAHVVENHDTVDVVFHDGERAKGEVVERAEEFDLALVSVDVDDTPPLDLAPMDDVEVGDWVASVGHGAGAIWTYTTGMISNIYPYEDERPLFQTQIPVNPGNSGGPIVNRRGEAIGVVTFGIMQAQNLNFAIPVEQAIGRLDQLAGVCDCLVIESPPDIPIYVDDVMVGTGPRVVLMAEKREYKVVAVIDGKRKEVTVEWPDERTVDLGE